MHGTERGRGPVSAALARALWAIAATLVWGVLLAGPAMANADGCLVTVDGRPLDGASDAARSIRLTADALVRIEGRASVPITRATVGLALGPIVVPVYERSYPGGPTWSAEIPLSAYTRIGAGTYEVVARTDACTVRGWIRIDGRSPFETVAGWLSAGAMAAGALGVLSALLRGVGARGIGQAFVGGAVAGAGGLVFAQQSGAAITEASLVTWTLLPGAAGGAAQILLSAVVHAPSSASHVDYAILTGPSSVPDVGGAEATAAPPPPAPRGSFERPTIDLDVRLPTAEEAAEFKEGAPPEPVGAGAAPSEGATVGATAPSAPAPEPPRTSYARVACPDAVVAGTEFELIVGLTDRPDPRVASGPMRLPDWVVGPYTMTVQVVADGFALRSGERWRLDLPVSGRSPYPYGVLHLAPEAASVAVRPESIRAMYSVAGQPIGLAVRSVAVVRDASLLSRAPRQPSGPAVELGFPEGQTAPDLTVRIERAESEASGKLLVQLLTADPTISLPDAPIRIDIGGDPAAALRRLINDMNQLEGRPTQFFALRGFGLTISEQLPHEFWDVLAEVAARVRERRPTILFLSAEPYVPWELAVVEPPFDPDLPPFLSAQANVGRWVLGQRRPKLPPPAAQRVGSIAVVSGIYDRPGWARLVEAEAEAADLVQRFGAAPVNAATTEVLGLLRGDPSADLIHFAVHGSFDAEGIEDGLILVDGVALDPLAVRGVPMRGSPFVFLNACQVGRGYQILGDHAGLADAFLFAGASGVIAPLWSVDDRVARSIALRFYEGVLEGETAAEVLRRGRAAFRDSPQTVSSAYMAYQYFGHPALRLERSRVTVAAPAVASTAAGVGSGAADGGAR